jgi:type IV pilus assembly protein PilQ
VIVTIGAAYPVKPGQANKGQLTGVKKQPKWQIEHIDFTNISATKSQLVIDLNRANMPVSIEQKGQSILLTFADTGLIKRLRGRRLDVTDFATPVHYIDAKADKQGTTINIVTQGEYDYIAYQTGKRYIVEIARLLPSTTKGDNKLAYSGERLSLNFQDIPIRSVLQIIADFTGLNMVVTDTVQGNITLSLQNVPWDQALDIVLKTKGLDKRREGNVMIVAPADEMKAREKQQAGYRKQAVELAPLQTEFIQIKYAKAADMGALIHANSTNDAGSDSEKLSLLSRRGSLSVDIRTNTLLIKDTASNLEEIHRIIRRLDRPVKQVLIEARFVKANNDFSKELGVRSRLIHKSRKDNLHYNATGASLDTLDEVRQGDPITLEDSLNIDFGAKASDASRIAFDVVRLPFGTLLDLELSALESTGRGEVISSPKVLTADQQTAKIEKGTEIPYEESTSSGATSITFREAVLKLEVTPQITPDNRLILALQINNDSVGRIEGGDIRIPTIETQKINTTVLVDDGETIVLGGIFENTTNETLMKTPLLGDIPYLGRLFRYKEIRDNRTEILVFITPKIIYDDI